MYLVTDIFNIGFAFAQQKKDNEALNSFLTCKWIILQQKTILGKRDAGIINDCLLKVILKEQKRIYAAREIAKDVPNSEDKKKALLSTQEIDGHLDDIWIQPLSASKESREICKSKNFNTILRIVHGNSKTKNHKKTAKKGKLMSLKPEENSTAETNATNCKLSNPEMLCSRRNSSHKSCCLAKFLSLPNSGKIKKDKNQEEDIFAHENKAMKLDQYFKETICKDMQISCGWLEEGDPHIRFRQDKIESILNKEKNSLRSLNILRDFLRVKKRDSLTHEIIGDQEDIKQNEVFYSIGHKMLTLKNTFCKKDQNEKKKIQSQTLHKGKPETKLSSPKIKLSKFSVSKPKLNSDQKTGMTTRCENLQRDIYHLERKITKTKSSSYMVFPAMFETSRAISRKKNNDIGSLCFWNAPKSS